MPHPFIKGKFLEMSKKSIKNNNQVKVEVYQICFDILSVIAVHGSILNCTSGNLIGATFKTDRPIV